MSQPVMLRRPRDRDERASRPPDVLSDEGIGWIGAHGGAGASTLTRLLGGVDIGCRWPDPAIGEPARVALVGRTNSDGLRAVSRALNAMREGRHPAGMRLVGVVLIADSPGRLPGPLLNRIRLLRSIAPVHRVPWIPSYRVGAEPKRAPRQLDRLAAVVAARPGRGSR
ncbi:DUF6668 family protein [Micromonospora sp. NBS 11-29]|uniref:DUF6668 family protein n=1 Tax=Micromonospora sp. NBS 11-29 TaxID=1960879 RepID=UPI0020CE104B|nr:DUF6668 family protein [Micromonospora sp. NBS 11-29]